MRIVSMLGVALVLGACSEPTALLPEPAEPLLADDIVSGEDYACVLVEGGVNCAGTLGWVVFRLPGFVSITGGRQYACVLRDTGDPLCWGKGLKGETFPPYDIRLRQIAAATEHACAITVIDTIRCWGSDEYGQIERAPRDSVYDRIAGSVGGQHSCALTFEGAIRCWGRSDQGQTAGLAGTGFVSLALTQDGGCALDAVGAIRCWNEPVLSEAIRGGGFGTISAGPDYLCALRAGVVECFGEGTAAFGSPPEGNTFIQVASGYRHMCAIRRIGQVACRGSLTSFPGIAM